MVKIVNGNILDATENLIVHQVNCQGVMGSGLAKQLRDKFSNVYSDYKNLCNQSTNEIGFLLGEVQYVKVGRIKYVVNLFGQDKYGRDKQHTNYRAFEKAFESIVTTASFSRLSTAIPYGIGCGLAGGDWGVIYPMIERLTEKHKVDITIYKYEV